MPRRLRPILVTLALLPVMIACSGPEDGAGTNQAQADAAGVLPEGDIQPARPLAEFSESGAILAGRHALTSGDDEAAAKLLSIALAADPDSRSLASRALAAKIASGDFSGAATLAGELAAKGEQSFAIALTGTVDAVLGDDLALAKTKLTGIGDDGIGRIARPLIGAWLELGQTDQPDALKAALDILQPLDGIEGLSPIVMLHAALIEDQAGDRSASLKRLKAVNGTGVGAARIIELYVEALHRAGETEAARQRIVQLRGDAGNGIAGAIADPLERRLAVPAQAGPILATPRAGIAEALFDIASVLQSERALDQAKLFARLALVLDPKLDIAHLLLGNLKQQKERCADALLHYSAVDPESIYGWSAQVSIADCRRILGDIDGAIAVLRQMEQERPERIETLIELGDLYRFEERHDEAIAAYSTALERLDQVNAVEWVVYYHRGIAHEKSKDWPKAESDFLKALELSPDEPYVLNYLAYSWVERRERLDEALEMLRKAVEQRPEEGFIVDSLGWAYFQLGHLEEAVGYLERAVELQPSDPVLNDHLGDAYWRVGRRHEARFQWRRALSFKPAADQIGLIEVKIKEGLDAKPAEADSDG
jgi:tetratricopeptide (TPR) repeat protein